MQNMDYYFEISKLLIIYLTNYFELMKQQPIFLQGFFKRRDLFDIKMDQIYQKFNEQGLIYFSIHTGPDIETNDFQFYKTIYSESLAFLLGKTLSELEEIFRRTGVYDYFDFQTSIEIVRLMVEFKIQFFNSLTQNKQNICQSINENLQFKKQFKVFTYDDLEFYTDVQCKIYKMSDFCDDSKHFLDFYCSILVLDISPSMLKQIITIREQNLKFKELNESKQENIDFTYNIEYMAQAEIFKEKYVDEQKINYTKYLSQYSQNQNKVCNYKLV